MSATFTGAVAQLLFLFMLGLATGSVAQADADTARRIQMRGFSIVPPPGTGWAARKISSSGLLFLDVARSKRDHTLFVRVELTSLDGLPTESAQQFASGVASRMEASENRFRVLEAEAIPYSAHGTDCVRIRRVEEESGNRLFPGVLLVETRAGFVCRHPQDPRLGVLAAYSERRPSGAASFLDESLRKQVEEFLSTVLFTEIQ